MSSPRWMQSGRLPICGVKCTGKPGSTLWTVGWRPFRGREGDGQGGGRRGCAEFTGARRARSKVSARGWVGTSASECVWSQVATRVGGPWGDHALQQGWRWGSSVLVCPDSATDPRFEAGHCDPVREDDVASSLEPSPSEHPESRAVGARRASPGPFTQASVIAGLSSTVSQPGSMEEAPQEFMAVSGPAVSGCSASLRDGTPPSVDVQLRASLRQVCVQNKIDVMGARLLGRCRRRRRCAW